VAVGACANELVESAREQIQTMISLFIVVGGMRLTLYLDSTILSQLTALALNLKTNGQLHSWWDRQYNLLGKKIPPPTPTGVRGGFFSPEKVFTICRQT